MIAPLYRALARIQSLFQSRTLDRQVEEELEEHIALLTEEYLRRGLDSQAARREALLRVGSRDTAMELHRETRSLPALEKLVQDVRYASRQLRGNLTFTTVAVLTLAMGIGANAAVFSLINSLMWRKLPVKDASRLVLIAGDDTGSRRFFDQVRRRTDLVDGVLAYASAQFNLSSGGESDLVDGIWASGSFFDTLGVGAVAGRTFSEEDDRPGGGPEGPVAVISYNLWERRYRGEAGAIGRTLTINRVPFTIIGVTPRHFFGLDVGRTFDVIVPVGALALMPAGSTSENWVLFNIFARLKPGHTLKDTAAGLQVVQRQIRAERRSEQNRPEDPGNLPQLELIPAASVSFLRSEYQRLLLTMMAVTGFVLLIACANLANLLLARSSARQHEMSVRQAIGASRGRLFRQLLTESLLLAGMGAAGGLLLATWGSRLLVRTLSTEAVLPVGLPVDLGSLRLSLDVPVDWHVLAFTAAVAAATALLFGIVPAFRAARAAPMDALKELRPNPAPGVKGRLSGGLVLVQVAMSLVLLVLAGQFVRSFASLSTVNLGFRPDRLLAGASPGCFS